MNTEMNQVTTFGDTLSIGGITDCCVPSNCFQPVYTYPQIVVSGGYCPPRELLRLNVKGGGSIVVDIPLPMSAEQTKRLASIAEKLTKALKEELA